MNDLVHSIVHKRLLSALRLPSFAGRGLPERMRSTAFALLGMTAAAALFLVAIFAQLSFPLVEPAPLPDEPTTHLAGAQRVNPADRTGKLVAASPAPAVAREASGGAPRGGDSRGGDTASPAVVPPQASAGVGAPATAGAPDPGSGPGTGTSTGGGGGASGGPATEPSLVPTATAPAGAPTGSGSIAPPVAAPAPVSPPPKATTSTPTPPQPVAPGNSASTAAAEHASDRGIEASSGSAAAAEAPVVSEPADETGNGNGLAKGQSK